MSYGSQAVRRGFFPSGAVSLQHEGMSCYEIDGPVEHAELLTVQVELDR